MRRNGSAFCSHCCKFYWYRTIGTFRQVFSDEIYEDTRVIVCVRLCRWRSPLRHFTCILYCGMVKCLFRSFYWHLVLYFSFYDFLQSAFIVPAPIAWLSFFLVPTQSQYEPLKHQEKRNDANDFVWYSKMIIWVWNWNHLVNRFSKIVAVDCMQHCQLFHFSFLYFPHSTEV